MMVDMVQSVQLGHANSEVEAKVNKYAIPYRVFFNPDIRQ